MEEVFSGIFVFTMSVILLWTGIFYINKKRYKEPDDGMKYILKFTPLPQIINYWLVKIFYHCWFVRNIFLYLCNDSKYLLLV